jgi:hypothetical protein
VSDADHDHSGDRLGEDEPVESIRVNEVTVHEFATPAGIVVFEREDDTWAGLRTDTQDIVAADDDGVQVINDALQRLAAAADADGGRRGVVRVTSNARSSATRLDSQTPIEHTVDGTELVLEPGVRFDYGGDEHAVVLAGDRVRFEAHHIESAGAYAIRDLGLSNSQVYLQFVRGGTETLWFSDAANQVHAPEPGAGRTTVHVAWAIPRGDTLWEMTSAPDASFTDYRVRAPVMFGADEVGIVLGDDSPAQTVNHNMFYVDVDGRGGPRFVVNDSHNVVYLKDYVPGSLTDTDVLIRPSATDTTVVPDCVRGWPAGLVTQREALAATDFSKFDPFMPEVLAYDLLPESLAAYETIETGDATVELFPGFVEVRTGPTSGSEAGLRRHVSENYGRLKFNANWAAIQTNVWLEAADDQEAWLLWGDRDGPGVGWHVADDVLEGYVHDGGAVTTVPLRTGFDPGTAWNLTAFYNAHRGVQYWVEDVETEAIESDEPRPQRPHVAGSIDPGEAVPAGGVSVSIPGNRDSTVPHQVLAIDIATADAAEKTIRWSNWRNHQYPLF